MEEYLIGSFLTAALFIVLAFALAITIIIIKVESITSSPFRAIIIETITDHHTTAYRLQDKAATHS